MQRSLHGKSAMMVLNVALRPDPTPLMTPAIAIAIPAAISPYSIAVPPDIVKKLRESPLDTKLGLPLH